MITLDEYLVQNSNDLKGINKGTREHFNIMLYSEIMMMHNLISHLLFNSSQLNSELIKELRTNNKYRLDNSDYMSTDDMLNHLFKLDSKKKNINPSEIWIEMDLWKRYDRNPNIIYVRITYIRNIREFMRRLDEHKYLKDKEYFNSLSVGEFETYIENHITTIKS